MAYDLRHIFNLIYEHLQATPTASLTELQRLLRIDRHTLLKAVKSQSGKTYRELRSVVLLEQITKHLVENPAHSLKEISCATGYSSQRSMSRFVKTKMGICPTHLRMRLD